MVDIEGRITGLVIGVVMLIVLIGILAGVTPFVLDSLDNLSASLVDNGLSLGSLLASNSVGGILWFVLAILIVIGSIFLMLKEVKVGK